MELKKVFDERRSVNFFDAKRQISEDLLRMIFDVAKLAPSSFNLQPWKVILVMDPKNKKKLREAAFNQPKVEEASAMLLVLGDTLGYEDADRLLEEWVVKGYFTKEAKPTYVGMTNSLYGNPVAGRGLALRNAGLFAMAFMLAAVDFGVDTHPMDGFEPDKVRAAFNIPERYEVALLIAVGYHDKTKTLLPRNSRKGWDEVIVKEGF